MRISPVNINFVKFGEKYKTADVLRFVTNYSFNNRYTDKEFFKSVTGMELFSSPIFQELEKEYDRIPAYIGVHDTCSDEIFLQCPRIKEADDDFDCGLHLKQGRKAQDEWLKNQIKKIGKFVEIIPFKLDEQKAREKCKSMSDFLEEFFNSTLQ